MVGWKHGSGKAGIGHSGVMVGEWLATSHQVVGDQNAPTECVSSHRPVTNWAENGFGHRKVFVVVVVAAAATLLRLEWSDIFSYHLVFVCLFVVLHPSNI